MPLFSCFVFLAVVTGVRAHGEVERPNYGRSITTQISHDVHKENLMALGVGARDWPKNMFYNAPYEGYKSWRDPVDGKEPWPRNMDGIQAAELFFISIAMLCQDIGHWDVSRCGIPCSVVNVSYVQRYIQTQTGAAVLIGGLQKEYVVSFRGTSGIVDARRNLFFEGIERQCFGCYVHRGFYSHWSYLRRFTLLRLSYLMLHKSLDISLASVSLGAACNSISVADIFSADYPVTTVISFGSPRVGNRKWAYYSSHLVANGTFALIKARDVVPHLPPLLLGFSTYTPSAILAFGPEFDEYVVCEEDEMQAPCPAAYRLYVTRDHVTYFNVDIFDLAWKCGSNGESSVAIHDDYDLLLMDLTNVHQQESEWAL